MGPPGRNTPFGVVQSRHAFTGAFANPILLSFSGEKTPPMGWGLQTSAPPKEIGPLHLWLREPTQNARFLAVNVGNA